MGTSDTSLIDLLARLGFHPVLQRGADYWYISPFRPEEKTPSFSAQPHMWNDFGDEAHGGNVEDFVMQYFDLDYIAARKKIHEIMQGKAPSPTPQQELHTLPLFADAVESEKSARPAARDYLKEKGGGGGTGVDNPDGNAPAATQTQPLRIAPVRDYPALVQYLFNDRNITLTTAALYLKAVKRYHEGKQRNYFYLGFQNDVGQWELRNKHFKGVSGTKAITTLHADHAPKANGVMVFEGFMDFLSCLEHEDIGQCQIPVIVLNTAENVRKAVEKIKALDVSTVYAYLDTDKAAARTLDTLTTALPHCTVEDCSNVYAGYKDYNDFWQAQRQQDVPKSGIMR